MPRSNYYYYFKQANKPDKYKQIKEQITAIYHENQGRYSYRSITLELRNREYAINHKTVQRLMKEIGIKCMVRVQKFRFYKGDVGKIAPNLIKRDFSTSAPNQKWTTDITEFSLFGDKLYLSLLLDIFNGEIISYNKSELVYLRDFESNDEFIMELEKYINYYNNKRIKGKLKGQSPVKYRIQSAIVA